MGPESVRDLLDDAARVLPFPEAVETASAQRLLAAVGRAPARDVPSRRAELHVVGDLVEFRDRSPGALVHANVPVGRKQANVSLLPDLDIPLLPMGGEVDVVYASRSGIDPPVDATPTEDPELVVVRIAETKPHVSALVDKLRKGTQLRARVAAREYLRSEHAERAGSEVEYEFFAAVHQTSDWWQLFGRASDSGRRHIEWLTANRVPMLASSMPIPTRRLQWLGRAGTRFLRATETKGWWPAEREAAEKLGRRPAGGPASPRMVGRLMVDVARVRALVTQIPSPWDRTDRQQRDDLIGCSPAAGAQDAVAGAVEALSVAVDALVALGEAADEINADEVLARALPGQLEALCELMPRFVDAHPDVVRRHFVTELGVTLSGGQAVQACHWWLEKRLGDLVDDVALRLVSARPPGGHRADVVGPVLAATRQWRQLPAWVASNLVQSAAFVADDAASDVLSDVVDDPEAAPSVREAAAAGQLWISDRALA